MRLGSVVTHIITGFQSLKPAAVDVHRDIFGRVVERGDDFFHPQKFRGIPVFDVASILRHYQPQLDKLKSHVDIGSQRKTPDGRSLYDVLYVDVIARYVEFCHMIPASEDHHHSHSGGLLLHSIEASIEALRWAKEKDAKITGFVDIDAKVKPVMNYCAWLAALLHDAGKLMRDVSVNAVEVIHSTTGRPIKISEPIVSWHPAKESLIEWAKFNNVSAYSVNFLANRTHRRHNIDSSQILQPLLRGHYSMDYLLSTPIKQEVYSDLTRVLSGYTTSDDFLSESVRMGDSTSTTRSLGYLYDSRLGNRQASTVQRLYKTIKAASSDWDWNRKDGQGWIIGGEAYIRWSSSIDNIIRVSVELGYSLPTDAKNVLNIMDSNLITDLFDRKSPSDRIIRFSPGKFNIDTALEVKSGSLKIQWHDLLKLRGPQVIFAEAPMPFSQAGLIYLPNAEKFFIVTKEGDVTDIDLPRIESIDQEIEQSVDSFELTPIASPNPQKTKAPGSKKKSKQKVSPPPVERKSGNLDGIVFVNGPASQQSNHDVLTSHSEHVLMPPAQFDEHHSHDDMMSDMPFAQPEYMPTGSVPPAVQSMENMDSQSAHTAVAPSNTPVEKPKSVISMSLIQHLVASNVDVFWNGPQALVPTKQSCEILSIPVSELINKLEKSGDLEINLSNPAIKTVMHQVGEQKVKCIPLTLKSSSYFEQVTTEDSHSVATHSDEQANQANTEEPTSPSIVAAVERSQDTPLEPKKPRVVNKVLISVDTSFIQDGKVYCDIGAASKLVGVDEQTIIDTIIKRKHVFTSPDREIDESLSIINFQGQDRRCIRLNTDCATRYLDYQDTLTFGANNKPSQSPSESNKEIKPGKHMNQLDFLIDASAEDSLIRFLSNQHDIQVITENGDSGFLLDHNQFSIDTMRKVNKTKLRNYMRNFGVPMTEQGYPLSADQLKSILMSEVNFDE